MGTEVWGFLEYTDMLTQDWRRRIDCILHGDGEGILLNDFVLEFWHTNIGRWCQSHDRQCIPMFTEDLKLPSDWVHHRRLERAINGFDGTIALGNTITHEWSGGVPEAERYLAFADKHGFEWACTLCPFSLLKDLARGGPLRNLLIAEDVLTFTLTGNVLMGYLYDQPNMPGMNDTSLAGRNLHSEFGLTVEALRDYCDPMRIISGAGGRRGLELGSRVYADQLGFDGVLCWCPFDLADTLDVAVNPTPETYPEKCQGHRVGIGHESRTA